MLVLQILGAILLAIIVIVVAVYIYFRFFYHETPQNEPLKIHLVEDIVPEWLEEGSAAAALDELVSMRFIRDKCYTIEEMPVGVQFFYQEDIIAVLCRHEAAKVIWVDFVVNTADGKEYTFSNMEVSRKLDHRPECVKYSDKDASLFSLYHQARQIAADNEIKTVAPSEFRAFFETTYKADMAWRVKKGGMSWEEFTGLAGELSKKKTENLGAVFTYYKFHELDSWHRPAIEEYAERMGKQEDEAFNDSLSSCFIVPHQSHLPAFLKYLENQGVIRDDQLVKYEKALTGETDNYAVFDKINALLSPKAQADLVTTQDYPLPLRIYRQK